jgi:large-conductance mechanosensitive channel
MNRELPDKETGTGEESKVEIEVGNFIAKIIHIFLSVLAILLVVAGAIAIYDTVISDFPTLWRTSENEYAALLKIIDNLLLVAIAVEFALSLLRYKRALG